MKNNKFKSAYSLLELSIVIIIISILISGAMSVSVSGVNSAKVRVTKDRMQEIYKAMGNYLIANRRLPCPASLLQIETSSSYGVAISDANCSGAGVFSSTNISLNFVYGMVPIKTLGLQNEMGKDAFNSKIAYIVSKDFVNAAPEIPDFSQANFSTAAATNIITIMELPSSSSVTITTDAIMVLISYGANKSGAYNANSNSQNPTSADSAENENEITNPSALINEADYDNEILVSANNSDVFDDIVLFKRRSDFVEDFKAMFLIPCNGATTTTNFNSSANAYYGQIVTNPDCTPPAVQTRKCEAYGRWVNVTNACM